MSILRNSGLKVATQKYSYKAAGNQYEGENIYAVLHAPRGDATEAIVLVAAWRNMDEQLNQSGVALLLTLARYFKSMSLAPLVMQTIHIDLRMVVVVKGYHIFDNPRQQSWSSGLGRRVP